MPGIGNERGARRALAGLTLLALAVRFWGLARQSIWVDETYSIVWAGIFDGMRLEKLTLNLQGPLHALLLFLWSRLFGTGELALRSLGAVLGAATVPLAWWALRPLRRPGLALVACALLAVNPFHVWYSQEVRNYVLAMLCGVASFGAFLRLLPDGGGGVTKGLVRDSRAGSDARLSPVGRGGPPARGARIRPFWLFYTAVNVLGLLSNLSHAFVLASQGAWLLLGGRATRRVWRGAVLSWGAALLLLAPWWIQFYERRLVPSGALGNEPVERLEEVRPGTASPLLGLPYAYYAFATGFSYGPSLRELHEVGRSGAAALRRHAAAIAFALLAFGAAIGAGVWRLWRDGSRGRSWIVWLGAPVGLTFLVSVANLKMFNVRYASAAFFPFLVVAAAGILEPKRPVGRAVLLAVALLPMLVSLVQLQRDPRYWKEDARSAALELRREARPGDLLFLVGTDLPLREYYWRRPPGPPDGIATESTWPWFWDRLPFPEQAARFEERARSHDRTLALLFRAEDLDPEGNWGRYFDRREGVQRRASWPGVRLFVLEGERP